MELTRRSAGVALLTGLGAGAAQAAGARQAQAATVVPAITAPGKVVTRYTVASQYRVCVRSVPSFATPGSIVSTLPAGVALKGTYTASGLWFQLLDGTYAGRWISSGVLAVSSSTGAINGNLAAQDLTALPTWAINMGAETTSVRYLSRAAAASFLSMNSAFRASSGVNLTITEAYRNRARQASLYARYGSPRAAYPGTSNHGFGNSIDFGKAGAPGTASPYFYGRTYDVWLQRNAWRYGFDRPGYMDRYGSNPEWWHYNFTG